MHGACEDELEFVGPHPCATGAALGYRHLGIKAWRKVGRHREINAGSGTVGRSDLHGLSPSKVKIALATSTECLQRRNILT